MEISVPAEHKVKMKENEKIKKLLYSHIKYSYIHIYMFMQDTYWNNNKDARWKTSL